MSKDRSVTEIPKTGIKNNNKLLFILLNYKTKNEKLIGNFFVDFSILIIKNWENDAVYYSDRTLTGRHVTIIIMNDTISLLFFFFFNLSICARNGRI